MYLPKDARALLIGFLFVTSWSPQAQEGGGNAPLLEGLGAHHHEVTTDSERARRYFDQGLILAFGFNHAEAHRSFLQAAEIDPDCAICWWGAA